VAAPGVPRVVYDRSSPMDDRTFTARDGSTVFYFRPPNPEFVAIGVDEVGRMVRDTLPSLPEAAYEELADAVALWAPLPPELVDYVNKAIFGLQGMSDFIEGNEPTARTFESWQDLRNELFGIITALHQMRDGVDRVCDHEIPEPAPEHDRQAKVLMDTAAAQGLLVPPWEGGARQCKTCGTGWGPGTEKPQRSVVPRAYFRSLSSRRRPGRGAFLYFATELLRRHGLKKVEAMQGSSKLIALFWNDEGEEPYRDLQLEDVYRSGKEASEASRLITVEEFADGHASFRRESAAGRFVWVRQRSRRPDTGGGELRSEDPPR
jgi:hypothetical protein